MTAAAGQNPLFAPSTPAVPQPRLSLVPEGYAQKAMASLMQLHTELMDEKEKRVELHRRLMEKEQALAELKMYVKLLEEKVEQRPPARLRTRPVPPPPPAAAAAAASGPRLKAVPRPPPAPAREAPVQGPAAPPPMSDGWRSW
ncbi:MAG TPA: hypothetical protein VIG99_23585 [Myxococcaceae bacterium]|jgi:hypothetical protein